MWGRIDGDFVRCAAALLLTRELLFYRDRAVFRVVIVSRQIDIGIDKALYFIEVIRIFIV